MLSFLTLKDIEDFMISNYKLFCHRIVMTWFFSLCCCHVYKEVNRTIDCLAKKSIFNIDSNIWWSDFPRDAKKFSFEDYRGSSFNRPVVF